MTIVFRLFSGSLKVGDLIMQIDGIDTRGLQVQDVTEKLRGPPSSEVRLVNTSFLVWARIAFSYSALSLAESKYFC